MMFSNQSTVNLIFEIGHCRGRSMSMIIVNGNQQTNYDHIESKTLTWTSSLQFPAQIEITVSGKGSNDTIVDSDGNILEDMYIKLINIQIDHLSCDPYYLNKNIVLNTKDGQQHVLQYWGFNGKVVLDFSQSNSFYWHLEASRRAQ